MDLFTFADATVCDSWALLLHPAGASPSSTELMSVGVGDQHPHSPQHCLQDVGSHPVLSCTGWAPACCTGYPICLAELRESNCLRLLAAAC